MLELLVGRRFQGYFTLCSRFFSPFLTVLVHHRSLGSIYIWEMVLPDSRRDSRVRATQDTVRVDSREYETVTLSSTFQNVILLPHVLCHIVVLQPPMLNMIGLAIPCSLATTWGITFFLLLQYLDVSSSLRLPSHDE